MKTKPMIRLSSLLLLFACFSALAQTPGNHNLQPNPQHCNVNLGPDKTVCTGATVTLRAGNNPQNTYLWSDSSIGATLAVSASGTYSVLVTTQSGCTATDTVTITVDANALRVNADDKFLTCAQPCGDLRVDFGNGTAPYTILWSNGETTPRINICDTVATVYTVMVTDTFGCTNTDTVTVSYSDSLCGPNKVLVCMNTPHGPRTQCINANDLNFALSHGATVGCCGTVAPPACHVQLGPNKKICPGGSVTLDARAGWAFYLWSTGESTQTIIASAAGTFTVQVTDTTGCSATDSVTVILDTLFNVSLGHDRYINCGETCVFLNANASRPTPPLTYVWSTGDSVKRIQACDSVDATYSVTVTDAAGCVGSDTVNVIVSDSLCGAGRVLICKSFGNRSLTLCVDTADVADYLANGASVGCCDSSSIVRPFPHHPHHGGGHGGLHPHAGPNPFSHKTTIEYSVDEPEAVTVEVYNAAGIRVSSLFAGKVEGNKLYRVDFNAADLPTGVYIYKITTQSGKVYRDKLFLID